MDGFTPEWMVWRRKWQNCVYGRKLIFAWNITLIFFLHDTTYARYSSSNRMVYRQPRIYGILLMTWIFPQIRLNANIRALSRTRGHVPLSSKYFLLIPVRLRVHVFRNYCRQTGRYSIKLIQQQNVIFFLRRLFVQYSNTSLGLYSDSSASSSEWRKNRSNQPASQLLVCIIRVSISIVHILH